MIAVALGLLAGLAIAFSITLGLLVRARSESRDAQKRIGALEATISHTMETMEGLLWSTSGIAETTGHLVLQADQTLAEVEAGVAAVGLTVAKMQEILVKNDVAISEILTLGQRAEQIGEIMAFINHITDQTRLIAFNAALEAAGAGEAGKRFGVVASEIRRLADTIVESTGEIKNAIALMQEDTNDLVVSSEAAAKRLQDGFRHTEATAQALQAIRSRARNTADSARNIVEVTQRQQEASGEVLGALRDLAAGLRQAMPNGSEVRVVIEPFKGGSVNEQPALQHTGVDR